MIIAVIPARYASTRFPGKPLAVINGKSMIQRVYEQVSLVQKIEKAVVATDDTRIFEHVTAFGGHVVMTRADHPSGTDRCAEAAAAFPDTSIVINVQGDEPFIQPEQIERLIQTLLDRPDFSVATLARRIGSAEMLFNPNVVKVVFNTAAGALYFSRHPIPYMRGVPETDWLLRQAHFKHIGLYGFRPATLQRIAGLQPTTLEQAESLEQLRWLENGIRIAVAETDFDTTGIDTPEDLARVTSL
jgi:3-deoxy-manno-octulosonate cytidylyltransferase (CMP-KDO synthetase)